MKIIIINGPNLNLLGQRQPQIYGTATMDDFLQTLRTEFANIDIEYFQSNSEGGIIDRLHHVGFDSSYCGIILNAGAYTHTSLAIADAIAAITVPVVEVHISNTAAREEIRHRSLIAPVCLGSITGFGMNSYRLAVQALTSK